MCHFTAVLFLLAVCLTASAQTQQNAEKSTVANDAKVFQASISCTANVPPALCRVATLEFGTLQKASNVMRQIEVVIADEKSFQQERESISDRHKRAMQAAAKANNTVSFFGLASKVPIAPSGLDDAVLFILDDEGVRNVNKVIVSSELFRLTNGDYDLASVSVWSKYVVGYSEGWFWGRMQQMSELGTDPPK